MSDINQPCPTICSTCGRTSGKCESCIKVDAVLTPKRIAETRDAAECEWLCAGGGPHQSLMTTFALAISREVVGILARRPLTDEQLATLAVEDEFLLYCDQDEFNEIARAVEQAHGISTPAASGIGESGGEAA